MDFSNFIFHALSHHWSILIPIFYNHHYQKIGHLPFAKNIEKGGHLDGSYRIKILSLLTNIFQFSYLLSLLPFILFQTISLKSKYPHQATQSYSMILPNVWIYTSSIYVLFIRLPVSFPHLILLKQLLSFCLPWHHLNYPKHAFLVFLFLSIINYFHSLVLPKEPYCHRKTKKFLILLKNHQLKLKTRLFSPN